MAAPSASDGYYDLGRYRRSITTNNPDAELWFNRGLIWSYGFNHEEAVKCFERAIAADSGCAMAYWGVAYALGPNYNKPWSFFDDEELETTVQRTHRMVEQAGKCCAAAAGAATPLEKALVDALRYRYPRDHASDKDERSIWNVEYADAMQRVHAEFGDDLDVAALCADALMNLSPWKLWDLKTGEPAQGARTKEVQAILERALHQTPGGMDHPGVLHLYIHFIEMSPSPELGLPAADALRNLVPDSGHLNHMPTHIDVLVGDYARGIASNRAAFEADEKFLARAGALNFYTLYRMHDYHFCIYSALFAGQSRVALETVTRMESSLSADLLKVCSPPMADWLEGFFAMRVHALVRFGRWDDLIAPLPEDRDLFCTTTAMTHYAKAVALAAKSRLPEAEAERTRFLEAKSRVPESRTLFNNQCTDLLAIAEAMMEGEVAFRRGGGRHEEEAYAHLRTAIARDDNLPYDEPWGWMQPTRHAYGALLMERAHYAEAAAVYAEDLGLDGRLPRALQHPGNVWALHGYHECLVKLGRKAEADALEPALKKALERADVPIKSSCFCRRVEVVQSAL
ncbi:TPR domain protein [Apiospora saccharicola]|uniref:TPR domain protein n=1 Tax=Apiospora saccharicola TaxID=335842 RepID=A0ABR1U5R7_9PEZI